MQNSQTISRAWEHADRLADVLIAHGITDPDAVTDTEWALAASIAQVPAGDNTRYLHGVVAVKIRSHGTDPFAGLEAF